VRAAFFSNTGALACYSINGNGRGFRLGSTVSRTLQLNYERLAGNYFGNITAGPNLVSLIDTTKNPTSALIVRPCPTDNNNAAVNVDRFSGRVFPIGAEARKRRPTFPTRAINRSRSGRTVRRNKIIFPKFREIATNVFAKPIITKCSQSSRSPVASLTRNDWTVRL